MAFTPLYLKGREDNMTKKKEKKECVAHVEKKQIVTGSKKQIVTGSDQLIEGGLPKKCKSVAIVGFAPSTMRDVQHLFGNPDVEIWGLNQLYSAFPRIVPAGREPEKVNPTRWFQIHSRHSYDQTVGRDHSHHQWLADQKNFLIYMQKQEPDIPMSIEFPKDEILSKFRRYFTNSISWMLAVAIMEKFENIYLFGVDMSQDSEYSFERPSVEYFLGYIEGMGSRLILPEKSDLLKSMWLYPYEDESTFRTKMESRRMELRQRVNHLGGEEEAMKAQRHQLIGALENMNYIEKVWLNTAKQQIE